MPRELFGSGRVFIGVVHLPPLPGSPRWNGDLGPVLDRAGREATILEQGGVRGIIVENFGDAPFTVGRVSPETVSAMTLAVDRVRQTVRLPVGVNMLRNDARSGLAVAAVTGAPFIRVNVHYGVMAADEGIVQGEAGETTRQRRALDADVKIIADVLVKHAVPLGQVDLGLMARETAQRGLADGLIVSGPATGQPAANTDVLTVRRAVPDGFILVGSGVDENNIWRVLEHADGAIIGTSLKYNGKISQPNRPGPRRTNGRNLRNPPLTPHHPARPPPGPPRHSATPVTHPPAPPSYRGQVPPPTRHSGESRNPHAPQPQSQRVDSSLRPTTDKAEARKGRGPRFSSGRRGRATPPPVIPAKAGIHARPEGRAGPTHKSPKSPKSNESQFKTPTPSQFRPPRPNEEVAKFPHPPSHQSQRVDSSLRPTTTRSGKGTWTPIFIRETE